MPLLPCYGTLENSYQLLVMGGQQMSQLRVLHSETPTEGGEVGIPFLPDEDPTAVSNKRECLRFVLIISDGAICQSTVGPREASTLILPDFNNLCFIHHNTQPWSLQGSET